MGLNETAFRAIKDLIDNPVVGSGWDYLAARAFDNVHGPELAVHQIPIGIA